MFFKDSLGNRINQFVGIGPCSAFRFFYAVICTNYCDRQFLIAVW